MVKRYRLWHYLLRWILSNDKGNLKFYDRIDMFVVVSFVGYKLSSRVLSLDNGQTVGHFSRN